MSTKDMPDETRLPGHTYTLGEMRETIRILKDVNQKFYWLAFSAGLGAQCHAFIEFAGLQGKFIEMCEAALDGGIEFPFANTHSRSPWPLDAHHAAYLGEKFNCIYGFAIGPNPKLRDAFIEHGLGPKKGIP